MILKKIWMKPIFFIYNGYPLEKDNNNYTKKYFLIFFNCEINNYSLYLPYFLIETFNLSNK